jgi:TfoX/Sxy family transcriptional regulator of competence genes
MASNIEFVEYVCDQINNDKNISYRKMFGEYAIYCNEKVVGLICDNKFFLKITDGGRKILKEVLEVPAYKGAKPSFLIEMLDDRDYMSNLINTTYNELPDVKVKKKK